jgi:replicative DNA helicase
MLDISSQTMHKGLPADTEVERYILATALLYADSHMELIEGKLKAEDFYLQSHQLIFTRLMEIWSSGVTPDRVLLSQRLAKNEELAAVGGLSYLMDLAEGMPRIVDFSPYVERVREKALLRKIAIGAAQLVERACSGTETAEEIVSAAAALTDEVHERGTAGEIRLRTIREVIEEYPGGPSAFLEPRKSDDWVPMPWPRLQDAMGGLYPGDLMVVAAGTSVGKSLFASHMAEYAAEQGRPVGLFGLEMSDESTIHRLICGEARIPIWRFRKGELSAEERQAIRVSLKRLAELPLYLVDRMQVTIQAIRQAIRASIRKHGICLAIIDYLQLVKGGGKFERRDLEVQAISQGLKAIARELGVAVVALSQLSNEWVREKRKPGLQDLRESKAIAQDADIVALLWRKEKTQVEAEQHWLLLRKQRQGGLGDIELVLDRSRLRFFERHQIEGV